jgi:tRNA threonylcarbamoyl adenosine modification protein (Sua5/YciO/YrdC/YwlC family)
VVRQVDWEVAAQQIRVGDVGAFPTETVYGLGAHPFHPLALQRIFSIKGRSQKQPLSLHIGQLPDLFKFAQNLPASASLLAGRFWPGPLALIVPASPLVPAEAQSDRQTVAFRYPANDTCQRFLRYVGCPVAATSANKSGSLSPLSSLDVEEEIGGEIDFLLQDSNPRQLESTIVDLTCTPIRILRQGAISKEQLEAESGLPFVLAGPILDPLMIELVRGSPRHFSHFIEQEGRNLSGVMILSRERPISPNGWHWVRLEEDGPTFFVQLASLHRARFNRLVIHDIWQETSSIHRRLVLRATKIIDLEKGEGKCI